MFRSRVGLALTTPIAVTAVAIAAFLRCHGRASATTPTPGRTVIDGGMKFRDTTREIPHDSPARCSGARKRTNDNFLVTVANP
jgi:hypothetical protein